jgi:hypothetical protein
LVDGIQDMRLNGVEKCSNCGVEVSEEVYYLNEGLCEKCNNENLEKDDKFRNVDVPNEKSMLPVAQEYVDKLNALLTTIEDSRVKAIAAIEKDAKSFLSDKKTLGYIVELANFSYEATKLAFTSGYAIEFLNRKTDILKEALLLLVTRIKEMPETKDLEDLNKISKQITDMDEIMQKLRTQMDNDKNALKRLLDKSLD